MISYRVNCQLSNCSETFFLPVNANLQFILFTSLYSFLEKLRFWWFSSFYFYFYVVIPWLRVSSPARALPLRQLRSFSLELNIFISFYNA